ncbi:hypothetical protein OAF75_03760 [Verrucomicrobiales bacterium]|nr:hypothetical protein [Verrucomicrobiales bacterium]
MPLEDKRNGLLLDRRWRGVFAIAQSALKRLAKSERFESNRHDIVWIGRAMQRREDTSETRPKAVSHVRAARGGGSMRVKEPKPSSSKKRAGKPAAGSPAKSGISSDLRCYYGKCKGGGWGEYSPPSMHVA